MTTQIKYSSEFAHYSAPAWLDFPPITVIWGQDQLVIVVFFFTLSWKCLVWKSSYKLSVSVVAIAIFSRLTGHGVEGAVISFLKVLLINKRNRGLYICHYIGVFYILISISCSVMYLAVSNSIWLGTSPINKLFIYLFFFVLVNIAIRKMNSQIIIALTLLPVLKFHYVSKTKKKKVLITRITIKLDNNPVHEWPD